MIPKSCVTLLFLFWFFLHLGFGWGGGRGRRHEGFFFIVGNFSNYQLKICTEIQLVCLCIFKACFLNLSRVIVFKEPAQPVVCLKKMYLHFEVPFECHSPDLSSILFNCYVQAPHKSTITMLDGIKNSRLREKLVGLHWGREGKKICVLV